MNHKDEQEEIMIITAVKIILKLIILFKNVKHHISHIKCAFVKVRSPAHHI